MEGTREHPPLLYPGPACDRIALNRAAATGRPAVEGSLCGNNVNDTEVSLAPSAGQMLSVGSGLRH